MASYGISFTCRFQFFSTVPHSVLQVLFHVYGFTGKYAYQKLKTKYSALNIKPHTIVQPLFGQHLYTLICYLE